jgi:Holliday junction resolvasome RuvABC endonuclease subunit
MPSQIDRVEMTIGEQVFVSKQAPSAVFYGEITVPLLLAISQAKLPVKMLIYSEGKTIEASFSEIGASAALRWIGAID